MTKERRNCVAITKRQIAQLKRQVLGEQELARRTGEEHHDIQAAVYMREIQGLRRIVWAHRWRQFCAFIFWVIVLLFAVGPFYFLEVHL